MSGDFYTVKLRRDTANRWYRLNPVLEDGEPGYEKDTGKMKIGNGSSPWRDLEYVEGEAPELTDHINAAEPHPVYDDGPSLTLLYENAKV